MYQPVFTTWLTILAFCGWSMAAELETLYEWKYIDYVWKNNEQKQNAIRSRVYNYKKILPVDFQPLFDGRVLVTTPRYFNNPASMSVISNQTGDGGPLLEPYPSWEWHAQGNCSGITSIGRMIVDKCNRLWVVDSGKVENRQRCPAQILAFDLTNDQLLRRVKIPNRLAHNSKNTRNGRLEIQLVNVEGDCCEEAPVQVYIGDPEGYGIVIWDGTDIWRLENEIFEAEPLASTYLIGLDLAYIRIGVSIFLKPPPGFLDHDYLIFKPISSLSDYAARFEDLLKSKTGSSVVYWKGTIILPSQELTRYFSDSGLLMATLSTGSFTGCYYLQNPLALEFVGLANSDPVRAQFTSSGKVVKGPNSTFEEEYYWEMSNRRQKFVEGTLDYDDFNFRILRVNIAALTAPFPMCQRTEPTIEPIEQKSFFKHGNITTIIL